MKKLGYVMLVLALIVPASAFASGTLIYEQGSKASAQAGAFVARADDATALFYNPAGTAFFGKGFHTSFNLTYIHPSVKYQSPTVGSSKNTAVNFFLPAMYLTYGINDRVTLGFSVNAPFNLATDWNQNFPGRFIARHSQIVSTNYHPTIAFKVNDNHAFSFGLDYYHSKIHMSRNRDTTALSTLYNGVIAGNFWVLPGPTLVPQYLSSEAYLTTDLADYSLGWDVGYKFKNDRWAVGLTYKSKVAFDYTGHTYFYTDANRLAFDSTPMFPLPTDWTTFFPAQGTSLSLDSIPAVWAFGVAYTGETFTAELDIQRTQWSSWDNATARFSNPTTLPVSPFLGTSSGRQIVPATEEFVFDWSDTYCYRLGLGYKLSDSIELRGGILFDEAPVPDHTLSPLLPDQDRWSLQFGMGYTHEKWGFDWYVMYLKFDTATVTPDNMYRYGATGLPTLPGPWASLYRTTYDMLPDGDYKGSAWLAGCQFNYKF